MRPEMMGYDEAREVLKIADPMPSRQTIYVAFRTLSRAGHTDLNPDGPVVDVNRLVRARDVLIAGPPTYQPVPPPPPPSASEWVASATGPATMKAVAPPPQRFPWWVRALTKTMVYAGGFVAVVAFLPKWVTWAILALVVLWYFSALGTFNPPRKSSGSSRPSGAGSARTPISGTGAKSLRSGR